MPDLLEIEQIASNTPFRTVTLSGISVTVLFSALNAANRIHDWWAGDLPLDQSQIDQMQAWLALAYKELMVSQIGQIFATAAAAAPAGSLICDGGIYDRVDYPDLYAVLDSAFIIDADTFVLPDLRERFIYGAAAAAPPGTIGGLSEINLSVGQLPPHTHSIPSTATTLAVEPGEVTVLTPIPIITSDTGSTGSGDPVEILPPLVALMYCIVAV